MIRILSRSWVETPSYMLATRHTIGVSYVGKRAGKSCSTLGRALVEAWTLSHECKPADGGRPNCTSPGQAVKSLVGPLKRLGDMARERAGIEGGGPFEAID